ncbi:hypothetical protein A2397_02525 [Candidatus Amesbacteria bacterium RIFOXYB1_FULL_44_23]|uniref:dTDP-4-dehydrorhamnose reductase n=1 Tax=Candidatus Amesbacteria bacterium RIFOXYB1_FULL_44_23 TaxID=1797263 RepID=A0A1F4ZVJ1_9BACT|nr:MAG: hypothetical protein A2397_02525 [Candidatus Amesbacteria bacterium RIFOXYB1_FULL_44_23]
MKLLVTGASGLVGSRFLELTKYNKSLLTPDLPEFDLTSPKTVHNVVQTFKPDVIIHFAAFTDVTAAENQKGDKSGLCWQVNVVGTKNLLTSAKTAAAKFIYISTDMVFSGSTSDPGPYTEDHLPESNPDHLTWYGYSKAMSEELVRQARETVVRIIYPVRSSFPAKLDYLRKPLSLFDQGKLYPLFSDQQISITFIDELCLALDKIITIKKPGIYHVSSGDTTTPYDLISYLIKKARGKESVVQKSSLMDFLKTASNPNRYPIYGGLSVQKTETELGIKFSSWHQIVDQIVASTA